MGCGRYQRRRRGVPSPLMSPVPRPHPSRRALRRRRQDRRGHRRLPGNRADDRRWASWPPGPRWSSPRAKADAVDAAVAELSAFGSCTGPGRRPVDRGGGPGLRRAPSPPTTTASTCWSTTPAPPGGHRWPSTTRRRGTGCSTSTSRGCSTPPSSSCPCSRPPPSADDPARVINIGSIDGIHVPVLESYSYSSSKAAVHQLTRHLARHLAPTITVNAVAPGPFESKMMAATLDAFGEQIAERRTAQAHRPTGRYGRGGHLPGLAGRGLPDRGDHPGRRGHRHRRLTAGSPREDHSGPGRFATLGGSLTTQSVIKITGLWRVGAMGRIHDAGRRRWAVVAGSGHGPRDPRTAGARRSPRPVPRRPARCPRWWASRTTSGWSPRRGGVEPYGVPSYGVAAGPAQPAAGGRRDRPRPERVLAGGQ